MFKTPINRSQGRSVVLSTRGIVASEHPLASQAGAMVLADGGHAVDAAIAANAVMGVVCPVMCGIGGDLFAIVSEADGSLHGVNASGWAPSRLSPESLERLGLSEHASERCSFDHRAWGCRADGHFCRSGSAVRRYRRILSGGDCACRRGMSDCGDHGAGVAERRGLSRPGSRRR